jgi:hypothetical protein
MGIQPLSNDLGTPNKPLMVKCTSIGRPARNHAYVSAVTDDGRQICLGMSFDQWRLLAMQSSQVVAGWPVNVEEPAA